MTTFTQMLGKKSKSHIHGKLAKQKEFLATLTSFLKTKYKRKVQV